MGRGREHGRSAYLLSGSKFRLLLDCGVKKEGSGQYPLIDPEIVPQLDAVLLSHAHEDHSVAIPLLYKMGYQGEVWTTRETKEQLGTYFRAWRSNMERAGYVIPYDTTDEQRIRYRFLENEADRGHWFEIIPGVAAVWGVAGIWLARSGSVLRWRASGFCTLVIIRRSPCFYRMMMWLMDFGGQI